ncbi:hypothetical protein GOBAR_AA12231 [Gossypium barbadense]|uniref:Uncharacterized protein n=1 Tax=Gossypium barbadense TaxID=3634 RepID=A0A2P5XYJ5_GOSBA|nr:hypothetical protein GOBAR_AA12231 [Gossypium barbadense]
MSSSRGKKVTVPTSMKRKGASSSSSPTAEFANAIRGLLTTDPWELFFGIIEPTYLELTMDLCSIFHLHTVMSKYDDPGTVQFYLSGLIRQLSIPEFPGGATYNPSYSKASALPSSLRYLHVILAHTITGRRESTEEAYEEIPDDVPPHREHPMTQPPPPSCPDHAVASYADIFERLTQFEHQCFQRFDNIDATLQQICQHLHISSLVPPREPSSDEDV